MLFSSYVFLLLFLPCTMLGFFLIGGRGRRDPAIAWLVATSLFFYAWWKPDYLAIIVLSMLFNFGMGRVIRSQEGGRRKAALIVGVAANLLVLAYYKYAHFLIGNLQVVLAMDWTPAPILLPLAISFFTFQQVAYLVDCHRERTGHYTLLHYSLFVTFFPQLIAGPIVHHKEMMPQFAGRRVFRVDYGNLAVGFTLFTLGLFKKVVLADNLAHYANPVFGAADAGTGLTAIAAWGGALAYTFQLYFYFSGYSDMAIGLARLFGVRLPTNFNSPYKAHNIIDFWHRWHMTLSRFLRDHIYIPLGGNRLGKPRRYVNVFLTMLLGGLWHGAGWTFVAWGALHGFYLMANHAWRTLRSDTGDRPPSPTARRAAWLLTFVAVVVAWVLFRAETFAGALTVLSAMVGASVNEVTAIDGIRWKNGFVFIAGAALIAGFLPNTQQFMRRHQPTLEEPDPVTGIAATDPARHSFNYSWCLLTAGLFAWATICISRGGEFLYFNF